MDPEHLEIAKEIDRSYGIDPLPPDWYYFPVAEIMTANDVVGVQFVPGFSRDLTRWKLWISSSGLLSVLVVVCKPYEGIVHRYEFRQSRIGQREVRSILRLATRIQLQHFADRYESDTTDCAQKRIAIRFEDQLKLVAVDCPGPVGVESLWRRVHRYAPLVNGYLPWWARGFRGWLFDR